MSPALVAVRALLLAAGLLVLAAYFYVKGRWPARAGSNPHCRNCDYLLSGLSSDRCPECGTELTTLAIVIGDRVPVVWKMQAALALLLLAAGLVSVFAYRALNSSTWRQNKPTAMLLNELPKARPTRAGEIFARLETRVHELSDDEIRIALNTALTNLRATPPDRRAYFSGSALLASALDRGAVAAPQASDFAREIARYRLCVPPVIAAGSVADGTVIVTVRGPNIWRMTEPFRYLPRVIGGRCNEQTRTIESPEFIDKQVFTVSLPVRAEAGHDLAVSVGLEVVMWPTSSERPAPGNYPASYQAELTARSLVLADEQVDREILRLFDGVFAIRAVNAMPWDQTIVYAQLARPMPAEATIEVQVLAAGDDPPIATLRYHALAGETGEIFLRGPNRIVPQKRARISAVALLIDPLIADGENPISKIELLKPTSFPVEHLGADAID